MTNIILTWSSGSGLLSAGDILMDALQEAGYFIVADREYPSLIKGGCTLFRIEVSVTPVTNISEFADIIVAFDRVGSKNALPHVRDGGLLVYGDERHEKTPQFDETINEKRLSTIYIPEYVTPKKFGANELLSNMLMLGALWRALGLEEWILRKAVEKRFASKPVILALDLALINHGFELKDAIVSSSSDKLVRCDAGTSEDPGIQVNSLSQSETNKNEDFNDWLDTRVKPEYDGIKNFALTPADWQKTSHLKLLDGNECLALSAVHHGVRAYFAYPMSPSSTILSHLANWSEKTGMHVEQVEDEISVAQMTLGASFGGTRSLCATSGGGFDLMTETVSLAGMIETPLTIIVAQRPGPATGLPTWSAQEDLNLAIYSGHGEYAKAVIAVGDHAEAFTMLGKALNLAETFQIPVIVLTDKTLAETTISLDTNSLVGVEIERWITDPANVLNWWNERNVLNPSSRYELTPSGISPRWLPGTGPRYFANGDEHHPDGTLTEDSPGVTEAHEKRIRKMKTLEDATPEPILFWNPDAKITLVGHGSTKMEIMDFLNGWNELNTWNVSNNYNYLHYTHIWPLKTETIKNLQTKGNRIIVVEHNMTGQFANLLRGADVKIDDTWLKYDGRRFYREEIEERIQKLG